jgi:hypothetical protein
MNTIVFGIELSLQQSLRVTCPSAHGLLEYRLISTSVFAPNFFLCSQIRSDVEESPYVFCSNREFQCCHRLTAMLQALCFSIISFSQSTPGPLPLTVSIRPSSMHHQNVQYGHHSTNIG